MKPDHVCYHGLHVATRNSLLDMFLAPILYYIIDNTNSNANIITTRTLLLPTFSKVWKTLIFSRI